MVQRASRVLTAFGLVGAALVHCVATALLTSSRELMFSNLVAPSGRRQMIGLVLGGFVACVGVGAWIVRKEREDGLTTLDWLARLLCPVLAVPFVWAASHRGFGNDAEEAVLIGLLVLGAEQLLRVSFKAWDERPTRPSSVPEALGGRVWRRLSEKVAHYFAQPKAVLTTVIVTLLTLNTGVACCPYGSATPMASQGG